VPYLWVNYLRGDQGRSETVSLEPELDLKVSSRFTTSLSASYERNRDDLWESRAGSALFLVWNQGREGSLLREGAESFRGYLGALFHWPSSSTGGLGRALRPHVPVLAHRVPDIVHVMSVATFRNSRTPGADGA
jgi:hypothetical protein